MLSAAAASSASASAATTMPPSARGTIAPPAALQRDQDGSRVRAAMTDLVARTFVQPVLAEVRDNPIVPDIYGEKPRNSPFAAMLDEAVARDVTERGLAPLVDSLSEAFRARHGGAGAPGTSGGAAATTEVTA